MSGPKRVIAHLDCDAFYATVELLRRPELKGKPVIVAGSGPRAVVTTASYEARKFGVGSAMPAARARRLCPDAITIPPDFQAYRDTSKRVWEVVAERLDRVQQLGLDEAYADLTGVAKPLRVLREVVEAVKAGTGIVISVGIGPSRLVAKCCSDLGKPNGFVAMGREEACVRFATAPTSRVPGIGPKTAERLAALGIHTLGHLQEADEGRLGARFGSNTARFLKARAAFEDDSEVSTEQGAAKSRSSERTFDEDIADVAQMETAIREMSRELADGLVRRGRRGRNIAIKVRLDDWTTVTRARTLEAVTQRRRDDHGDGARAAARVRAAAAGAAARREGRRVRGRRAGSAPRAARAGRPARAAVLVERSGELAPRVARERVLDPELVEHADDRAPQVLAPVRVAVRGGDRRDQLVQPALGLAESSAANADPSSGSCSSRIRAASPSAANEPVTLPSSSSASASSPWSCSSDASATLASAWPGSSSIARRSAASSPAVTSASASDGSSSSRKRATCGGGCAPTNSAATLPSTNALTAGMPWIWNAEASRGLASVSTLARATLPSRSRTAFSSTGVSWRQGPHQAAQKSTTTGISRERSITSCSKVGLGGGEDHAFDAIPPAWPT